MSSKSILFTFSYTVSKLVHFSETQYIMLYVTVTLCNVTLTTLSLMHV